MLVGLVVDVGRTAVRVPLGERHGESSFGGAIGWVLAVKGSRLSSFAMRWADATPGASGRWAGRRPDAKKKKKQNKQRKGMMLLRPKDPRRTLKNKGQRAS